MQNSRYQINKYWLGLAILLAGFTSLQAAVNFSIEEIRAIGLPVVIIETVDGEEPTCDYVSPPEGSFGQSITNATKVPCRILIVNGTDTLYNSGEYEKDVSGATIKINGNTSAYHDNKPYKLKLEKKADLLCRGDKKYKDKNWRLLKDARTLRTIIGLKMNELMGMPWTPAYQPCNVFVNRNYRGCYLLIESVKRNSDCRLDVDKETGFIVERDPYWWNEEVFFASNFFSPFPYYRWTWKYPDEEDVTDEQTAYIQDYLNQVEKSIEEGNYEQYIDINSFASWLLAHDMMGTWDSGGSNLYVMKYDNTPATRLQMANMWDFDSIFWMESGSFSRIHTGSIDFYFTDLLNSTNKAFAHAYKQRWEAVKDTVPQQVMDFVKAFAESEDGKALQTSREYYTKRWNKRLTTVAQDVQEMTNWFEGHLPLLDEAIQAIDDDISGISPIVASSHNAPATYNLHGQQVSRPGRGIYIMNGKKYMAR